MIWPPLLTRVPLSLKNCTLAKSDALNPGLLAKSSRSFVVELSSVVRVECVQFSISRNAPLPPIRLLAASVLPFAFVKSIIACEPEEVLCKVRAPTPAAPSFEPEFVGRVPSLKPPVLIMPPPLKATPALFRI